MASIPLGRDAYARTYGKEPEIKNINRFFEQNPTNQVENVALLSRPSTTFKKEFGSSVAFTATAKLVGTGGNSIATTETMANGSWGGSTLSGGTGSTKATGTLTVTGVISNGETVTIGTDTYTFVMTLSSARDVLIGASISDTLRNLIDAVAATTDLSGVVYGSGTVAHADVDGSSGSGRIRQIWSQEGTFSGALFVVAGQTLYRYDKDGTTTAITGTLSANGTPIIAGTDQRVFICDGTSLFYYDGGTGLTQVSIPDNNSVVSVGVLNFHVLVLIANSQRFYWIEPGETTINALNFAEAEATPDEAISLRVVGDVFWLLGEQTSEMWYATGLTTTGSAFAPQRGVAFTRGTIEGTDVRIDDHSIIVVGDDNIVYHVVEGQPRRISNHGIEERIRLAKADQFGAILS